MITAGPQHPGRDGVSYAPSLARPPRPAAPVEAGDWWRQAVVYQIYPRSFADSDGDGIGDLRGIISRIPYLVSLDVDAVWLSPFYPSALADGGYDVDDYRGVDPRLGTLADFEEMTDVLHAAGMKVVVDIVPNHTSDRHAWFTEALAAPKGAPARDRYIFRDGLGPDGAQPPSDWDGDFGPCWTRVPDGQWYLHLFTAQQPDLNWANQEVRDDFLTTLRFWSDRGVDGFRVDVAQGLAKDLTMPLASRDQLPNILLEPGAAHPFWDRDEVHEIYSGWRQVFDKYQPPRVAVAEAWVHRSRRACYASSQGLGQSFNFDLLVADWDAAQFRRAIIDGAADAGQQDGSAPWVLANHDAVRQARRYGLPDNGHDGLTAVSSWLRSGGRALELDRGLGLRRARAAVLLMLALPGSAYLYQGEELGLHEVADIPDRSRQDPIFWATGGQVTGRDGCRVPLPWTAGGMSFGFGPGPAHLPQPDWFGSSSTEAQELDLASTLSLYREALRWRRKLRTGRGLEWDWQADADVVSFRRPGGWRSVTNFGPGTVAMPAGTVILTSDPAPLQELPPDTTAWLLDPAGSRKRSADPDEAGHDQ